MTADPIEPIGDPSAQTEPVEPVGQEPVAPGAASNDGVCSLPRDSGPCEAAFPRFHFDASTGACREFLYGGCRGNANNFETLEACEQTCMKGDSGAESA